MTASELRKKYLDFFESRGHKIIPSASLIPENDPSVLFTTAGMHPLVSFLMGQPHPSGKRLVNIQKCLRTDDIDEVGDLCHHTFFEMLGNWSLGDYFKKEVVDWTYELLVKELKINPEKIFVTCFGGDDDAPKDIESFEVWQKAGIPDNHLFFNGKAENWWGPVGQTGPCGPDTEFFYDLTGKPCSSDCQPGCSCDRFTELGNNVFIQYNKTSAGKYELLKQQNVDTGMGFERILTIANGLDDDYQTELFLPIIEKTEEISNKKYDEYKRSFRIIADHLKAAVFICNDNVIPSNLGQGYILRRLIRRAIRNGKLLKIDHLFICLVAQTVIDIYAKNYPNLEQNAQTILITLAKEEEKFQMPLDRIELYRQDLAQAINHHTIKKIKDTPILSAPDTASGTYVYENYQNYGTPPDLSKEVAEELGLKFDQAEYDQVFQKHQELSRTASAGMFKGGLIESSEAATKYHTTTHLLHAALRQILGEGVEQKGSNITAERLRFDFSYSEKLTEDQIKQVEDLVNQKIKEDLKITQEIMDKEVALKSGALGFFAEKYADKVAVYTIGDFSKEICGGPHTKSIGDLGTFNIIKEDSAGLSIRRIYAVLS